MTTKKLTIELTPGSLGETIRLHGDGRTSVDDLHSIWFLLGDAGEWHRRNCDADECHCIFRPFTNGGDR